MASLGARLLAVLTLAAIVVYPVTAFLRLGDIPLVIRLAWIAIPIAAWRWPIPALLGFLVAAPLVPTLPTWFRWPPVAPAEILLFGILMPTLLRTALGTRPWKPRTNSLALLLALVAAASAIVVVYPLHLASDGIAPLLAQLHRFALTDFIVAQSQNHWLGSLVALAILLEGLALMWLLLSEPLPELDRGISQILTAAAAGATAVAALGVLQWWTGQGLLLFWRVQNPNIIRINSTFTDVNGLGSYLAMMVPIALGLAMRRDGAPRWMWRTAAGLIAIGVLFTGSRSAWAALAIGLAVHGLAVWRFEVLPQDSWLGRHIWHVAGGTAAVLAAAVVVLSTYATVRDVRYYDENSYFETFLYTVNLRAPAQERMKGRLAFWSAAATMIEDRPVFGIGLGRFFKDVSRYAPDPQALPRPNENAHNYFLQIAAELGLAGFFVLAALVATAFVPAVKVAASVDRDAATRHLALAVAVAMATYLLTWTTGHPLLVREGQFAFWPIVAAAYLYGAMLEAPSRRRPVSWLVWTTVAIVLISVPIRAASEEARVDLTRLTSGFHDPEVDPSGRQFQWTHDRVLFHVPGDAAIFEFDVRALAPFEQTVDVLLDGVVADRMTLRRELGWRHAKYPIRRRQRTSRYLRVELVVAPVWRPSTADPRQLGVQFRDLKWIP